VTREPTVKPGGWTIKESGTIYHLPIFQVRRSVRKSPRTGVEIDFILIDGFDWVSVIPITADNEVIFVKQYRHGREIESIEAPGGVSDDETASPLENARRELSEETGYSSPRIEPLGRIDPNPAMFSMQCHLFVAWDCVPNTEQNLDDGEDIEVMKVPLSEVPKMLLSGEITYSVTIAAFTLLFLRHKTLGAQVF